MVRRPLVILQDTREQQPWDFSFFGCKQEVKTLETGDYTLKGPYSLIIERKKSPSELAMNVGRDSARFHEEMERMSCFQHAYIICEFTRKELEEFPKNARIPWRLKRRIKVTGSVICERLGNWCAEFGVNIVFAESKAEAEYKAYNIIKEIYENKEKESG